MAKEQRIEEILREQIAIDQHHPGKRPEWTEHIGQMHESDVERLTSQINALFPQVAPPEVLEATIQLRIDQALKDKFPQGDDAIKKLALEKSSVAISEAYFRGRADGLAILEANEEEIRKKVKAIQNPYTAEFFPRDDKWAGQILREKGLTDDEIGGVSGALGRVAFEYIMAEIDRLLEP